MQYRNTFLSAETGGQMTRKNFLEGTDVMKAIIFAKNKSHRKPIEGKVESWVKESWATWEEEKPDWFTDQWKARVPEYMKPAKKKTGNIDYEDKTAAENEGGEVLTVAGGEEQKGRRRSVLETISGQTAASSKVMPEGGEVKKEIDEAEFMREIKRQGSMVL